MGVRRLWMIGAAGAMAIFALLTACAAEDDRLIATVDTPVVVTASPAAPLENKGLESDAVNQPAPRVVVHVTGYQPAQKGAVRGVVKVQKPDGSEQEIGTFGMFPDTAFKADTSRARSYSFPLPKELATGAVKLKIEVAPDKASGTAKGAHIEVGRAEIR